MLAPDASIMQKKAGWRQKRSPGPRLIVRALPVQATQIRLARHTIKVVIPEGPGPVKGDSGLSS
jgi:hypothetical protein